MKTLVRIALVALALVAVSHVEARDFTLPRALVIRANMRMVADTTEPDSLPYPLEPGQSGSVYLNNPANFNTHVDYDPLTGQYIVTERVGDLIVNPPIFMTVEEYQDYVFKKQVLDYWQSKTGTVLDAAGNKVEGERENSSIIPQITVRNKAFGQIFGSNVIDIRPQGIAELTFGVRYQKVDNPILPERNRKIFNFNFNQRIQMNVTGKIGEKLNLAFNYDTQATFNFENKMKVDFTGFDDDIIKKIELGNVNLPINSSLITGAQSLFGVKGQFQFGKLMLTAVVSEQQSQTNSINIQGGATATQFELWGDQYEANKHYFLGHYFRDNYESWLSTMPVVNSPVQITRIEVWVTNTRAVTQDVRSIVAFGDLGEAEENAMRQQTVPGDNIFAGRPGANQLSRRVPANNNVNALNPQDVASRIPGVRDIASVTSSLRNAGYEEATEFAELANARRLQPNEFTFNPQLGYITLNSPLNQDEVLGVAYQYTAQGRTYQVGEFSNDGVNPPATLIVKMLKSTILLVNNPLWDLMMKNVYSLGAFQVNREDFRLDILYMNDETGTPVPFLPKGNLSSQLLLRVMELDRLNVNNDPTPDGFFDFVPGITINTQTGRIFFPVLEPFGTTVNNKLTDQASRDAYVFQQLYDSTLFRAQEQTQLNKYLFRGQFKSSSSSEIALNAFNIPKGSVVVSAGGARLTENVDYTVDYNLGRVKILNESILNSGTPIKIDFENNSLFNFQTKSFMGLVADYKFNENLTVGGTVLRMAQRPVTQKVNIGEEPVANTVLGFNGNYSKEAPFLTRLVDKIPFIDTKESSSIAFQGEVAKLFPGSPNGIKINGEETTYLDDFESAQTRIDVKNTQAWVLASAPAGQPDLFPEADLNNDLAYGYNRAKIAWYIIDPLFHNNSAQTPDNIRNDPNLQSGQYVRRVDVLEVFPNVTLDAAQARNLNVFDLAYYPDERGPYNFDVNGLPGISAGVDADGKLLDPASRWGGIMRALQTTNFEQQNVEFIQFWLLDPFLEDPTLQGGDLLINLGSVTEDILKDGRQSFENGVPATGSKVELDSTVWGYVPRFQPQIYAFDNAAGARPIQDVGLDGLNDAEEAQWPTPGGTFLQDIQNAFGTGSVAYQQASADPGADNFQYFRGSELDAENADILERYKNFNSPQGNSSTDQINGTPTAATQLPDVEDINRDLTLNKTEAYFQYEVSMRPGDLQVGKNYITDRREASVRLANNTTTTAVWYQFKIPIFEPDKRVGPINDFRSIRFMRMFLTGFDKPIVLRFARLDLVRGEWRSYRFSLDDIREVLPGDQTETTLFDINAVNLEENGSRIPIPYVLPPGIDRQVLFGTAFNTLQNEQSLSLRVCNLQDGDARAVFKTINFDMRLYKNLRMFVHAEAGEQATALNDDDLTVFIRMGSDFNQNYYEYEIPLKATPWGTQDPNAIWPAANEVNLALDILIQTKLERDRFRDNNPNFTLQTRYSKFFGDRKVSIIGAPNLGNVRTIMIGVRNPKKLTPQSTDDGLAKCAEIWVNELRLTGFDNSGGEAATGRVTAKLADFAQVSLSGKYTSVGWGSIDKNVLGRNRDSDKSYDFQSSLELGKFFGDNARVRIPFYFQQSEQWRTPQFDPLDPDVEFGRSLDNQSSEEQRDTLERIAQDYTLVRSFNFTNVRKERSQNSRRKISLPWDIENFTASYSFSQNYRRNISTVYSNRDDFRANLTYAYNVRPILVEPFRKVKFLQNKWLALIRDFNFYFYPSRFSVRGDVVSSYHVQQMRNTDNLSILLPVTYNKSYTFNRTWDLAFDLAKSLKLDYNSRMNTWIDELDGPRDSDSVRASIRDSWSRFGRPTQFQQTVNASWEVPIKKIPILDFVNITTRYTGTFNWQTNSLQALQSDTLNFGNTIQNSANIQFNGTLNMTTLYNKWRYFRDLNKAKPKNPPGPARRNPGEVDALGENGKRSKNGFVREVLDVFAGILISVKNLSLNYSNNRGTMMPGFLGTPTYFGLDNNLGQAPGIPFVFGIQEDIRPAAAENGWITTSKYQNNPYTTTLAENISVRGTIEPLPQFRIELSATRTWSESYMEFFRFNDTTGMFESQNPMRSGNLSLTFFSLPTAFEVSPAPGFPSANFDQFLANRIVISERLAQQRAAEDPNYNPVLVGNPDSANFGYDGFSVTNSDVLIFAFLSAYGGEDPDKAKLNFRQRLPLPNWRLTYDGLMNIGMFKRAFTNFSITHGYRSLYNLSSYVDNLIRQQRIADGETDPRDDKGDFLTEFQVAAITITEQFSPLIGFNARMKNSFTARAEFNRDRTLNLSLANNQLTEIKGNELIVGFGYIIKDLKFNLIRTGANKKPVVSNLELKMDVSIRDNQTVIRKIVEQFSQVTSGQTVVGVKFQADYAISQRVTTSFFYDQLINRYKVSNAFPTNAINVGFRVRLNLGN